MVTAPLWTAAEILGPLMFLAGAVLLLRRGRWAWSIAVLGILLLLEANLSVVPYALGLRDLFAVYDYESSDGGFADQECFKSTQCSWSALEWRWATYKKDHPTAELPRNEAIRPWAFWNWFDYATHPRWRLPYAPPGSGYSE